LRIRWTLQATQNLDSIEAHIERDNPVAAAKTVLKIMDMVERLAEHPGIGRPGRVPGTRELVMPNLPYIVPYRVDPPDVLIVLRVLHGAMKWRDEP